MRAKFNASKLFNTPKTRKKSQRADELSEVRISRQSIISAPLRYFHDHILKFQLTIT